MNIAAISRLPLALLLSGLSLGFLAPEAAAFDAPRPEAPKVRARAFLKTDKLPAGGRSAVAVVLDIQPGWHVNSNPAPTKYAVPTTVTVTTSRGTQIGEFTFPTLPPETPGGPRRPVKELKGRVVLRAPIRVPVGAAGGDERLTVSVKYQACDATRCLRPKTLTFGGMLPVAAPGDPVRLANAEWFHGSAGPADAPRTAER